MKSSKIYSPSSSTFSRMLNKFRFKYNRFISDRSTPKRFKGLISQIHKSKMNSWQIPNGKLSSAEERYLKQLRIDLFQVKMNQAKTNIVHPPSYALTSQQWLIYKMNSLQRQKLSKILTPPISHESSFTSSSHRCTSSLSLSTCQLSNLTHQSPNKKFKCDFDINSVLTMINNLIILGHFKLDGLPQESLSLTNNDVTKEKQILLNKVNGNTHYQLKIVFFMLDLVTRMPIDSQLVYLTKLSDRIKKWSPQNNQTLTISFEKLIMELIDHWWASQVQESENDFDLCIQFMIHKFDHQISGIVDQHDVNHIRNFFQEMMFNKTIDVLSVNEYSQILSKIMISLLKNDAPVHDQLCQLSFQIMGLISKRQINVNPQLTFDKHVLDVDTNLGNKASTQIITSNQKHFFLMRAIDKYQKLCHQFFNRHKNYSCSEYMQLKNNFNTLLTQTEALPIIDRFKQLKNLLSKIHWYEYNVLKDQVIACSDFFSKNIKIPECITKSQMLKKTCMEQLDDIKSLNFELKSIFTHIIELIDNSILNIIDNSQKDRYLNDLEIVDKKHSMINFNQVVHWMIDRLTVVKSFIEPTLNQEMAFLSNDTFDIRSTNTAFFYVQYAITLASDLKLHEEYNRRINFLCSSIDSMSDGEDKSHFRQKLIYLLNKKSNGQLDFSRLSCMESHLKTHKNWLNESKSVVFESLTVIDGFVSQINQFHFNQKLDCKHIKQAHEIQNLIRSYEQVSNALNAYLQTNSPLSFDLTFINKTLVKLITFQDKLFELHTETLNYIHNKNVFRDYQCHFLDEEYKHLTSQKNTLNFYLKKMNIQQRFFKSAKNECLK